MPLAATQAGAAGEVLSRWHPWLASAPRQRVEELAACRREMADLEVRVSDAEEVAESERDARMAAGGELEARLRERERAEAEAEALRRENGDLVSRVVVVKQELADKMNELMEREQVGAVGGRQ